MTNERLAEWRREYEQTPGELGSPDDWHRYWSEMTARIPELLSLVARLRFILRMTRDAMFLVASPWLDEARALRLVEVAGCVARALDE